MSSLPPSAANAARNAINAVNAEFARKDAQLDDGEGQELTLEDRPEEEIRTVFNDPTTFNVKVRILSFTTIVRRRCGPPFQTSRRACLL